MHFPSIPKPSFNSNKVKGGLRRKFFLTVVLPPLIPLIILGFLGYQRMNDLTKASLANRQGDSAATTAAKLEREISIRQTILKKTAEEVFGINKDFTDQRGALSTKHNNCINKVNLLPDRTPAEMQQSGQSQNLGFDDVIGNPNCEYALSEFAKLQNIFTDQKNQTRIRTAYKNSVTKAFDSQTSKLNNDEQQNINERLDAYVTFFPETTSLKIFDSQKVVAQAGNLNLSGSEQEKAAADSNNALYVSPAFTAENSRFILIKHSLSNGRGMAVFNLDHELFLKPSWDSAPRTGLQDVVFIADSNGASLYPKDQPSKPTADLFGRLASGKVRDSDNLAHNFEISGQPMVGRSSYLKDLSWAVITASPAAQILAPLKEAQKLSSAALIIGILVALIVGLLFMIPATRAIKKLTLAAREFAKRNFNYRINLKNNDEIGQLALTMNSMAGEIEAAEKAIDEKNKEFISIATHELKAPMTSIIGNLSMVTQDGMGKVDDRAKGLITSAFEQTERLRDLINEMLDVARLEGKREQFEIKALDMASAVSSVIETQKVAADQSKISLIYEKPASLPRVKADATKLQIIITNFVSNAIKYNRAGGSVKISQTLKDGFVTTAIADTGLGIPQNQQNQIFAKFYRVNHEDRKNVGGTGLGMYITKQYIEAMGGKVWFESTHGKGTTFYFSLPAAV